MLYILSLQHIFKKICFPLNFCARDKHGQAKPDMRQTIHISVHSDAINGTSLTSSTQTILAANYISASI